MPESCATKTLSSTSRGTVVLKLFVAVLPYTRA